MDQAGRPKDGESPADMGLDGATPAEEVGISVEDENKWITLIQDAMKSMPKEDT